MTEFIKILPKKNRLRIGVYLLGIMSTLTEIKSKYSIDSGVCVTVDVGALREKANELLTDIASVNNNGNERDQWFRRWQTRKGIEIKEQKRQVDFAKKQLDEVSVLLDKASDNLAKVK